MDINALVAQATAAAETMEDQTATSGGGDFEYEAPPAGLTPARFVGYVEVGKRAQRAYQGKEKPPAEEVRLYFELNGPKHQRKVVVDGVEKTFTNVVNVKLTKKLNEKAGFHKLFKKMLYGRDGIKHMAQLLGEAFLVRVIQNTVKGEGGKKDRVYANIKDDDGNWLVQSPFIEDPMTGESRAVPTPEVTVPIKLLLWDNPSKEQWDSIFIDGSRTVKDERGVEREQSKNWLQEDIVKDALNFEGSALQALIGGIGDLDLSPETPAEAPQEAKSPAPTAAPAKNETPAPAPAAAAVDPLAALGLI